jgi:hypothetical protein
MFSLLIISIIVLAIGIPIQAIIMLKGDNHE